MLNILKKNTFKPNTYICQECEVEKILDETNFEIVKNFKYGFSTYCKDCVKIMNRKKERNNQQQWGVAIMLTIKTIGDKVLKQKAKRVAHIDDTLRNLLAGMVDCMYENNGIGLAAPQVGISKQIIIIDDNGTPIVMINPEILEYSETKVLMNEGCLSVPGIFEDVLRPEWVRVRYRNTKGRYQDLKYTGLTARIIQHEIDHLFGKLFVDEQ